MDNCYTKEKGVHDEYPIDGFIRPEEEQPCFHIGQCYEESPAKKLLCVKCGGDEFNVGQGSFFTAIKCPSCEWEVCIHDG